MSERAHCIELITDSGGKSIPCARTPGHSIFEAIDQKKIREIGNEMRSDEEKYYTVPQAAVLVTVTHSKTSSQKCVLYL